MSGEKKHRNVAEKHALRVAEIAVFIKQYGRKAQRGADPNDRTYDRDVEQMIRHMDPVELDRLLRDDEI